ncbi:pentapeptide repeat-containing protein [Micromonospora sonneratiae]
MFDGAEPARAGTNLTRTDLARTNLARTNLTRTNLARTGLTGSVHALHDSHATASA